VKQKAMLEGITVGQVMRTRFWAMPSTARVQEAVDELLAGGDSTLLVMEGGILRGLLTREELLAAVAEGKSDLPLGGLPLREALRVAPEASAHQSYQRMVLEGHPVLPVMGHDRVVGIMELDNLAEYLQLMQARSGQR
jgi:CBS domain-containing protein